MRSILILGKTWELGHVLEGDFIKFGLIFSHFFGSTCACKEEEKKR